MERLNSSLLGWSINQLWLETMVQRERVESCPLSQNRTKKQSHHFVFLFDGLRMDCEYWGAKNKAAEDGLRIVLLAHCIISRNLLSGQIFVVTSQKRCKSTQRQAEDHRTLSAFRNKRFLNESHHTTPQSTARDNIPEEHLSVRCCHLCLASTATDCSNLSGIVQPTTPSSCRNLQKTCRRCTKQDPIRRLSYISCTQVYLVYTRNEADTYNNTHAPTHRQP